MREVVSQARSKLIHSLAQVPRWIATSYPEIERRVYLAVKFGQLFVPSGAVSSFPQIGTSHYSSKLYVN